MADAAAPDTRFTLHVDHDPDAAKRLADAAVEVMPKARQSRRTWTILAVALAGAAAVAAISTPPLGLFLIWAAVAVGDNGRRRTVARRVARIYSLGPFIGEPHTYVADPSGLTRRSDTMEVRWAWCRVGRVKEHRGGLLIALDGGLAVVSLPPHSFDGDEHMEAFRLQVEEWIAAASTQPTAAAGP